MIPRLALVKRSVSHFDSALASSCSTKQSGHCLASLPLSTSDVRRYLTRHASSSSSGSGDDAQAKRQAFEASLAKTRAAQKASGSPKGSLIQQPSDRPSQLVPGAAERAVAGLSEETVKEWAEKARIGADKPVVWENPGELTWKYLRAFGLSLVLVGLAGYLHVKAKLGHGAARVELERKHPAVASLLVRLGVLADFSHLFDGPDGASARFDRDLLFQRLFRRFTSGDVGAALVKDLSTVTATGSSAAAAAGASWFGRGAGAGSSAAAPSSAQQTGETLMPLPRALALLAVLRGDVDGVALAPKPAAPKEKGAKDEEAKGKKAGPTAATLEPPAGPGAATLIAAVRPSSGLHEALGSLPPGAVQRGSITATEFAALAASATSNVSPIVLYLTSSEALGVTSLSLPALGALTGLYDSVIVSRASGPAFTPAQLSELATDIGLAADEASAAAALADSAAVASGQWALTKPVDGPGSARVGFAPVPLSRDEFADFCASAAAAASISEERIPDYVRVFRLLHLSEVRKSAGVAMH